MGSGADQSEAPLHGVRIVDFGLYIPGPYASRLLADLGASVTKVEPPGGDPICEFLPGAYDFLNRGKRAIRLNLKRPDERKIAHALLASADVVIEGFRPGVADRLGVDFRTASELRRDIIYCSISGYGQDGPNRDRPGHDIGFQASSGAFSGPLAAGDAPQLPYLPLADLGSALFAALTICATLLRRRTGAAGRAIQLDLSIQEATSHLAATRWGRFLRDGHDPKPDDLGFSAPGVGIFTTSDDRHVAIAAAEDGFWTRMCRALDVDELASPPYDTHAGRLRHRDLLSTNLRDRFASFTSDELTRRFAAEDVPLDPVRTARELLDDPHLRARKLLTQTASGLHVDFPVQINGRRSYANNELPEPTRDRALILAELGITAEHDPLSP